MWSQFTAASHIGSITAALLCLVSAPTCGGGGGVHGSYSQTAADNHAYISNHHFQEDNLLAWHAWYFKFLAFMNSISYTCFMFCRLCPSHPWCSSKCWSRVSLSIGWHCMCFFLTYFITSLLCNCYLGLSQHAHWEGVCCMTSTKPYAVACIAHYCICW